MTAPLGWSSQPITLVRWVPREHCHANYWNPNHMAPPERHLLRVSLEEDGWTQPLVVGPHATLPNEWEIIDGFHRWSIADEPDLWKLTDGLVPIVVLPKDEAERRLATVRHNRARGTHGVVPMADMVATLMGDHGFTEAEICQRLGMDREEVRRLAQRGNMVEGTGADQFGQAWKPAPRAPAP